MTPLIMGRPCFFVFSTLSRPCVRACGVANIVSRLKGQKLTTALHHGNLYIFFFSSFFLSASMRRPRREYCVFFRKSGPKFSIRFRRSLRTFCGRRKKKISSRSTATRCFRTNVVLLGDVRARHPSRERASERKKNDDRYWAHGG